jgi:hypothetical protein
MNERIPSQELTAEELEIAQALREKGPANKEALGRLLAWTDRQQAWAEEQNTSRANIEVNLRRARLYLAAGAREDAWQTLNEVRVQAANEQEHDLLETAEQLMDQIDQKGAS